ncbi:MAG: hypothetical protein ACOY3P_03635 [Planctomycetota bacterium]
MRPRAVFYHVCAAPGWQAMAEEQLAALECSGLHQSQGFGGLHVSIVGERQTCEYRWPEYLAALSWHQDRERYEFAALDLAYEWALRQPISDLLYLHTKGVTRPADWSATPWRHYMQWGVLERWRECTQALEAGYDLAGVEWQPEGWPYNARPETQRVRVASGFFAGNYWWARAEWIRRLPPPQTLERTNRWDAEAWLGKQAAPVVACLHNTRRRGGQHAFLADPGFGRHIYAPASPANPPPE